MGWMAAESEADNSITSMPEHRKESGKRSKEQAPKAAGSEPTASYSPRDVASLSEARDLGQPGEYPFTRGIYPTMYRGRLWSMRQYAGFGTAAESNRRYKYLLSQGQSALSVAFDLPTQIGMDSDHPLAAGEVGKVGVAIDSLRDIDRKSTRLNSSHIQKSRMPSSA